MAEAANGKLHWFCGPESSDVEVLTGGDPHTSCLLNTVYCVPHAVLILSATVILIYMRYFQSEISARYKPGAAADVLLRLRYPLHDIRWLLLLSLVLLTFFQFGEGLLTDSLVVKGGVHPQLFIPAIFSFIGAIVAKIFYDYTELWNKPKMLWLQVAYWLTTTTNEILRFADLRRIPQMNLAILKYDITLLMMLIYVSFIFMDAYLLILIFIVRDRHSMSTYGTPDHVNNALNPSNKYRHNESNFCSSLTVWWMNFLFKEAKQRRLDVNDLGEVPTHFNSHVRADELKQHIQKELKCKNSEDIKDASFLKIYSKIYGGHMAVAGAQNLMGNTLHLAGPLLLQAIIDQIKHFTNGDGRPIRKDAGFIYVTDAVQNVFVLVVLLFMVKFFGTLLSQRHSQTMSLVGSKVRAGLQGSVYLKAQHLSTSAFDSSDMSIDQISSHIDADPNNMQKFFTSVHHLWTAPVKLISALYLLYNIIGSSAFLAALVFVIGMLSEGSVGKLIHKVQAKVMTLSDDRVKETDETVKDIKQVKLNGLEQRFQDRISLSRDSEIKQLYKVAGLSSIKNPLPVVAVSLAVVVALGLYYPSKQSPLTPRILFPTVALFQAMSEPLTLLLSAISNGSSAFTSHNRLKRFLDAPEAGAKVAVRSADLDQVSMLAAAPMADSYGTFDSDMILPKMDPSEVILPQADNPAIQIQNATFAWDDPTIASLTNINIEIPAGKLTAIAGKVGSGKSSLLSAILGEMKPVSGRVIMNSEKSSISYASQKAWMKNASLKENILFRTAFDWDRYNKVIEICGLRQDIDMLPAGDRTEIGEKGINLSGGQKQRVSMARAVYSHTDIVIMDDPLSALDALVGSHVFEEALRKFLIEEGRTVLLVTHQTQFFPEVDKVIIMKNGSVLVQGTPDEIRETHPAMYDTWVTAATATSEQATAEMTDKDRGMDKEMQALRDQIKEREKEIRFSQSSRLSGKISFMEEEDEGPFYAEEMSVDLLASGQRSALLMDDIKEREKEIRFSQSSRMSGKISFMEEEDEGPLYAEEMSVGLLASGQQSALQMDDIPLLHSESCTRGVYSFYLRAMGLRGTLIVAGLYISNHLLATGHNFWMSNWSEAGLAQQNATETEQRFGQRYYIIGYLLLTMGTVIATYMVNAGTHLFSMRAGKYIHKLVLKNVTESPMSFFETTPAGKIENRFSTDMKVIDQKLGSTIGLLFQFALGTTVGLLINVITAPIVLLGLVPLGLLYWYIKTHYILTSREVRRIKSKTMSSVKSHFNETISGLTTIRAYGMQESFAVDAMDKINANTLANIYQQGTNHWLQFRVNFIGAGVILTGSLAAVLTFLFDGLNSSLVGMAITVSVFSAHQIMELVTQTTKLDKHLNAVERLKNFADLVPEKQDGSMQLPDDWPSRGDIRVIDVDVHQTSQIRQVLDKYDLDIKGGQKVGICQETWGEKSDSVMLAFFRLSEEKIAAQIQIDDIPLENLPLPVLRQSLSVVPQDPKLFTGTIRFNVDPFGRFTDDEIWNALDTVQLGKTVSLLPEGLDSLVTEGGDNFSIYQQQLFCLARAFLRKSRILIIEEATALVDKEMDTILQDVLFTAFADTTVLTIAHRVSTILSYDTIIVLSDGKVAEWDSPSSLLSKPDSIFSSLVNKDKQDEL